MIKQRKVTQTKIEYFIVCERCKKEIRGTSESMVKFNLDVHKKSKECRK